MDYLQVLNFQGFSNFIKFDENREILNPEYDVKIIKNRKLSDM